MQTQRVRRLNQEPDTRTIIHDAVLETIISNGLTCVWPMRMLLISSNLNMLQDGDSTTEKTAQRICTPKHDLTITVLSASVLFGKHVYFLQNASPLFLYERQIVQAGQKSQHTLWTMLTVAHFCNFLALSRQCDPCHQYDYLAYLYYLLHGTSIFKTLMSAFSFLSKLYASKPNSPNLFLHFMTKWVPSFPWPGFVKHDIIFYQSIPNVFFSLSECLESKQSRRYVPKFICHNLRLGAESRPHQETIQHTRTPKCIDSQLLCVFRQTRRVANFQNTPRTFQTSDSGLAYALNLESVTCLSLEDVATDRKKRMCLVRFTTNDQKTHNLTTRPYQVVIAKDTWLTWTQDENRLKQIVFFRHGSRVTQELAAVLGLADRFSQRIPRLKFGRNKTVSDGLFASYNQSLAAFHQPTALYHGQDVTLLFPLKLKIASKKKRLQRLTKSLQKHHFFENCVFSVNDLVKLNNLFWSLTKLERLCFYAVGWQLCVSRRLEHYPFSWNLSHAMTRVMSASADALVNLHQADQLVEQILNPKKTLLWSRMQSMGSKYCVVFPISVQGVMTLSLTQTCYFSTLVSETAHNADLFYVCVHILSLCGFTLSPAVVPDTLVLGRMLNTLQMPASLYRICYQCLVVQRQPVDYTELKTDTDTFRPNAFPDLFDKKVQQRLKVDLPFLVCDDHCEYVILVSRETKSVKNSQQIMQDCVWRRHRCQNFDVVIDGEIASGKAVYEEVLDLIWSDAVERGLFVLEEEDNEDDDDRGPIQKLTMSLGCECNAVNLNKCFFLGFLSSLCVHRGLHLPVSLSQDMWSYITHDQSLQLGEHVPLRIFFSSFSRFKRRVENMANAEFDALFSIDEKVRLVYGCNPKESNEFLELMSVPNKNLLQEFKTGWTSFTPDWFWKHQTLPALTACNMFNNPLEHESGMWTPEQVLKSCVIRLPRDERFEVCVHRLSPEELKRLVRFVTGKGRLPMLRYGESPISVVWSDEPAPMPRAQNCTHTLILPRDTSCVYTTLQPVFEFDTVFGFL